MTEEMINGDDNEMWPGVSQAYGFVLPSYQLMANRFEAADSRLSQAITLISSVLFGVPVLARTIRPDASFRSPLFLIAIALLTVAAGIGIVGRQHGRVRLINPMFHYEKWLHKSDWQFKKDAIYFAGESFNDNARAVDVKMRYLTAMNVLLLMSLLSALAWLVW